MQASRERTILVLTIALTLTAIQALAQFPYTEAPVAGYPAVDTLAGWRRGYYEGYTNNSSVAQGDTLKFMISCLGAYIPQQSPDVISSRMKIYRIGANKTVDSLMTPTEISFNCTFYPLHDKNGQPIQPDYDPRPIDTNTIYPIEYKKGCNWPVTLSYQISSSWPSGIYYAKIYLPGYENTAATTGYIPFVVKSANPGSTSKILFVVAWNTYQAYNYWGGGSLYWWTGIFDKYDGPGGAYKEYQDTVSFMRPFGDRHTGTYYIMTQLGQIRQREDMFIHWAESDGQVMEYCTDADVHLDEQPNLTFLSSYRAVIFPGHSEYWSFEQRDKLENTQFGFKGNLGYNLAFFGANTCYFKVEFLENDTKRMYCDKYNGPNWFPQSLWRVDGTYHGEGRLLGVQFERENLRNADDSSFACCNGPYPFLPNIVFNNTHWIYNGTSVQRGDTIGRGYPYPWIEPVTEGEVDYIHPDDSPLHLYTSQIDTLARVFIRKLCADAPCYERNSTDSIFSDMAYYEDTVFNARVFAGGGLGWSGTLYGIDSVVMRTMTRNVLDHFSWKKYAGGVHRPVLEFTDDIEFDDDVTVHSGKTLRINSATVTIDTTVILFIDGTLEITGSDTIAGKGQINLWHSGKIKINNNSVLRIKKGVFLDIENDADIEFVGNGRLEIEGDALAEDSVVVTVEAGATLQMLPGSVFYFRTGAGLSVSGTLDAQGTSGNRIAFLRHGSEDYWSGITLNEESGAAFDYCDILHAQVGINANTVIPTIDNTTVDSCKIGVSMFQSAGSITNSTITNNIIKGLIIDGENPYIDGPSAAPYVADNVISSNTAGIYITNGAPTLERNTITHNTSYGIWCDDGGNAFISKNEAATPGNNVLENNGDANLLVDNYSFPFLGYAADENGEVYGGYNSFGPEKHEYDVWAKNESGVIARRNYWSEYPPDEPTSFREDSHAWIDREFPLDSYSNRPMAGGSTTIEGDDQLPSNDSPGMSNGLTDELLQTALAHRSGKRFGRSIGLIRQYVAQRPTPPQVPAALVMMCQIALDSARTARSRDVLATFASYVDSLLDVTASERLRCALLNVKKDLMSRTHDWIETIAVAETLSARYPNSTLDEHALYATFRANLFGLRNQAGASQALNGMQQRFPESHLTAQANLLISTTRQSTGGNRSSVSKTSGIVAQQLVQLPVHYALHQNYPNPFNPSTTIKYDLPRDVRVTLRVYDVLGRMVTVLVDEERQSGYHQYRFDATNLASGVYFYSLKAGEFSSVKKLLLLR